MPAVNILIVDDRIENIIALEALLQGNDIKIFSTTSPNEGLKLAWANDMAIALVDVQMPEMDGFEFVETLKLNPRTKDIMVIFVTAISKETKYALRGLGTGAVDYLYKPLDPAVTVAKVDSFIQLARFQAEIKQKNAELENFAVVVKNSADIICVVEPQSLTLKSVNPAIEKIMGFKPDDVKGKSIINFAVEDYKHAFALKLNDIINNNIVSSVFDYQFAANNNKIIWAECRVAFQNNELFINISNISTQKHFELQLIKAKEKAEYSKKVKETFLANMSHELRTPVNGIVGLTTLLRYTELSEQQSSMINLLEISSQSLLGVINDVLDISKMEAGKFSIIRSANNLHDIIRSVYGLLKFKADKQNTEFILQIDSNVPVSIMVDSLRLNQILMNLLSNAIKFTRSGYVKLKVAVIEQTADQAHLKFSVEDSGIGIPESKLAIIFDSFEQAEDDTSNKYGGTGLGLAIVKRLIELKGGELNVSSQAGKGSIFTFTNWYTLAPEPKKAEIPKISKSLEPFENISILVAEDNLVNQFMLSKMLKDWGVAFDMVDNGRKLIDKLQKENYDLILMDTYMPEMNGIEAAKVIRAHPDYRIKNTPIISLSSASFDYEQEEALAAGMNEVVTKPYKPAELYTKIQRLLQITELIKDPAL